MELQTAIEILEYFQQWRLGKRDDMIYEPKELTKALDVVLSEVKKFRSGAVVGRIEQLPQPDGSLIINYKPYFNSTLINNDGKKSEIKIGILDLLK